MIPRYRAIVAFDNQQTNRYPQRMDPHKAMTIRLPADQAEDLNTVAAVDGMPISQVIRTAIADHIEDRKRDEAFQDGLRQRIERAQQMLPDV